MIMVRLMGGLGNQMFQYAFGRALALKYGTELVLDPTLLNDRTISNEVATHRHFELDIFKNLKYRLANKKEITQYNGDAEASVMQKAGRKISAVIAPKKLVIQKKNELSIDTSNNACYVGRWQSYKFFETQDDLIKRDLQLDEPLISGINEVSDKIRNCNSVCLHVRRTDLISSSLYSKTIGALDLTYYEASMRKLSELEKDLVFFIFSDDIEWCKKNIKASQPVHFIENDLSGKNAEGHLYLMMRCRHFIISNSTFSWWGAFLSSNKNKRVIYPIHWFKDEALKNPHMSPPEWIGI